MKESVLSKTRIGILCDMHLQESEESVQYAFLCFAAAQMKKDGVDRVICLGDVTGYGQLEAWELYCEALKDLTHYEVIGNSDVRELTTREEMINKFTNCNFTVGSRQVFGINVLDNVIYPTERAVLDTVKAGDIIYLHNHLQSLEEESMEWLKGLAESVPVVILHGHGHKWYDYQIGGSRVVGMR